MSLQKIRVKSDSLGFPAGTTLAAERTSNPIDCQDVRSILVLLNVVEGGTITNITVGIDWYATKDGADAFVEVDDEGTPLTLVATTKTFATTASAKIAVPFLARGLWARIRVDAAGGAAADTFEGEAVLSRES